MRLVDGRKLSRAEVTALLEKPPFDAVELGEGAKARISKVFGRELTAAAAVDKIVADVRAEGDAAVLRYTGLIDGVELTPDTLAVSEAEFDAALAAVDAAVLESIRKAVANVRRYHAEQLPKSWLTYREHGSLLGQNCVPLDRVGIYVPGGTAAYPSSVVMNAVPPGT
jgi:histidinol dehydrogenase